MVAALTGCPKESPSPWWSGGSSTNAAVNIDAIDLPAWPPLGPQSELTVQLTASVRPTSATAMFQRTSLGVITQIDSDNYVATFRASSLGSGLGPLDVRVTGASGAIVRRQARNVLIDLEAPSARFTKPVASPQGRGESAQLILEVEDQWVLGKVTVDIAGRNFEHTFRTGYPATLGKSPDRSVVIFDVAGLPDFAGKVKVMLTDAAGNNAVLEEDVVLDGQAPVADVSSRPGADPSTVIVSYTGSDGGNGDVTLALWAGGTEVARVPGPGHETVLDLRGFPPGPLELEVVAFDRAGNASVPATTLVSVPQ
jgi:hypothetical protein